MTEDEERAVLAKLEAIAPGEIIIFSQEEAAALREVSLWWRRAKGAMALGGALGHALKWFLVVLAFLAAFKAGMLDFLGGGK